MFIVTFAPISKVCFSTLFIVRIDIKNMLEVYKK